MSDTTLALEILDLALVPGSSPPVYAVGMPASRITFADQQRRAVNLIWALIREGRVQHGQAIAIVGGGVAGITAAAYALRQRLGVAVFEKFDEPFALQQGSSRWIHPGIYDWPMDGWNQDNTSLPCMNWRAGTAAEVIAGLRKEWNALREDVLLDWRAGTEIVSIEREGDGAMLVDHAGNRLGPYACVVMAAGFGEEANRPEFDGKPYWRDDDLHQRLRSGGAALVSGCGDGGLIDAIRVALQDFRHDWLSRVASRAAEDHSFVSTLLRVERDTPAFPDGAPLTKATLDIAAPDDVTAMIRAKLRPTTTVILNAGTTGPFTRAACLINRFVISELMKLGVVKYLPGKLDVAAIRRNGARFEVPIDASNETVDIVVVRHGPELRPLARFPWIESALTPARTFLRTYRAGVDRSRARAWGPIPIVSTSVTETLPPPAADVADYIAHSLQNALKDELGRQGAEASRVGYECDTRSIALRIRTGAHEGTINVALTAGTSVTMSHVGGTGKLTVALPADVLADSASAVPILIAKLPEALRWILGERT